VFLHAWFYEHTTRFTNQDKKRYPYIANWARVDHGGRYDASQLVKDIKEKEVMLFSSTILLSWHCKLV